MTVTYRIDLPDNRVLEFVEGDITHQDTDAIVNAANSSLLGGAGVDGAIHRAAGPSLLEECKKVRDRQGPLPTGKAVSTGAGNLKARYVIHTVGPIYQDGESGEPQLLADCYRNTLCLADMIKVASVAFPSISTGAYGYPIEDAAPIVVKTVLESLRTTEYVHLVRFVLWGADAYNIYLQAAREISAADNWSQESKRCRERN
ncbi:MAG TPA: O-acetyl-ADP-ribose deacetylase [Terriglobales bacterium]|nr:O-acetyl-ADP-ribose deacetylase [Terriglobales bacterium]